ncbi:hypothetical protein LIER_18536 [Lithospermum erythrorhizon]|uniref:Uncharacterized protein n=1 Tax=Lithospermum erythrorhizon TaxID=34254 RepID=A0AAV3QGX8_LITER
MSLHEENRENEGNIPQHDALQQRPMFPHEIEAEIQRRVVEQLQKERTMQSSRYSHHSRHQDMSKVVKHSRRITTKGRGIIQRPQYPQRYLQRSIQ